MGKIENKKLLKRKSLLDTAFVLFTTKGINDTSISDIVKSAGIAKGTFYLYFKDKYDIRNKLISYKASNLLINAVDNLENYPDIGSKSFTDKVLLTVDYILDAFTNDKVLLNFIWKNLSWGVFRENFEESIEQEDKNFKQEFDYLISKAGEHYKDTEIMLYNITEFVSSTCYSSILYSQPADIDTLKPYIFDTVKAIIKLHEI